MSSEPSNRYCRIYLVGVANCLSGALQYVFEREVCSQCVVLKDSDSVPTEESSKSHEKTLFLIDCLEKDFEKELIALGVKERLKNEATTVALFNLQKGSEIERRAFNRGIRGFFYKDDSLVHMLKGVRSLVQGEIWVSRDILAKFALQSRLRKARTAKEKSDLTNREVEILALLSIGSSNDDIADKLFISPNTVKTHLYRVFRKIKVPNRFQAALWAAKNL